MTGRDRFEADSAADRAARRSREIGLLADLLHCWEGEMLNLRPYHARWQQLDRRCRVVRGWIFGPR